MWKSCHPSPHHQLSGPLLCVIIISECHATPFPLFLDRTITMNMRTSPLTLPAHPSTPSEQPDLDPCNYDMCVEQQHTCSEIAEATSCLCRGLSSGFTPPSSPSLSRPDSTGWQRGCGAAGVLPTPLSPTTLSG